MGLPSDYGMDYPTDCDQNGVANRHCCHIYLDLTRQSILAITQKVSQPLINAPSF